MRDNETRSPSRSPKSRKPRTRFAIPATILALIALALPATAPAADPLGTITEYSAGLNEGAAPLSITEGPDGNLWFSDFGATKAIGRITTSGTITEFSEGLSQEDFPRALTAGPDGNVWFITLGGSVGRITPAGAITEFTEAIENPAGDIVAGSDGNLWLTDWNPEDGETLIRMNTSGVVTGEFDPNLSGKSGVAQFVAGADGNIWFLAGGDEGENGIGKFDPDEPETSIVVHYVDEAIEPNSMAYGPDGNLWFTGGKENDPLIGRMTPTGSVTEFSSGLLPTSRPGAITAGPDGNLWFADDIEVVNEKQVVSIEGGPTEGTFTLTFKGKTTAPIAHNASNTVVRSALGALETVGGNSNVAVAKSGTLPATVTYTVTFQNARGATDQPLMSCASSLAGGTPSCGTAASVDGVSRAIGRITPGGEITEYSAGLIEGAAPSVVEGLAAGPDGNVWFTDFGVTKAIGKIGTEEAPAGPALTVTKEGTGSGTVASSPAGIECGATCTAEFTEGSKVTLTASPSAGSLFLSWKGCEKGGVNGRQCTVTMDKAKTVVAKFIAAYDVTVNREGTGLGKVSSSPGGVLCLANCSSNTAAFKEGVSVTLNAAPSKNFVFTEWTGDCSGSGPCSLGALGEDKEVGAKFTEVAKHLLTATKSGGGQGTVKAKQAGINCGATCSSQAAAYYQGTAVELTATPGKGSAFGGWSGAGCSGTGTCTVTMSAAKSVTAEFK